MMDAYIVGQLWSKAARIVGQKLEEPVTKVTWINYILEYIIIIIYYYM